MPLPIWHCNKHWVSHLLHWCLSTEKGGHFRAEKAKRGLDGCYRRWDLWIDDGGGRGDGGPMLGWFWSCLVYSRWHGPLSSWGWRSVGAMWCLFVVRLHSTMPILCGVFLLCWCCVCDARAMKRGGRWCWSNGKTSDLDRILPHLGSISDLAIRPSTRSRGLKKIFQELWAKNAINIYIYQVYRVDQSYLELSTKTAKN